MLKDKAIREYAKKLALISLENGHISNERVSAVLETLRQSPPRKISTVLKYYAFYIRREMKKSQMQVEYAGELNASSVESLKTHFSKTYNRPLSVLTQENKKLIAGLRIHIGDDVYDSSVAGRLENFQLKTA